MRPRLALVLAASLALGACAEASPPTVDAAGDQPGATSAEDPAAGAPLTDETGSATDDLDATAEPSEPASSSAPTTAPSSAPSGQPSPGGSSGSSGQSATSGQDSIDPIPAGTYAYATEGWTQLGDEPRQDMPERTTLEVGPAGGDDVQVQVRDTRDEDGYGSRNSTSLRYGVEGVVLLRSELESTVEVFGSPFTSQERLEARPPVVIAPNGGGVGHHADLHLVGEEVTVDGTLDVVRREQVEVGGAMLDVFVVEVSHRLEGAIEGTSEATWWVRPDDLLVVREEVAIDVTSRGLRYREQYDARLTSTEPA